MITFGSKFLGDFDPFDTCRKFTNGKGDEWVLNDRKLHFCILKRYQIKGVLIWYDAFPGFTLSIYSTKNQKKSLHQHTYTGDYGIKYLNEII